MTSLAPHPVHSMCSSSSIYYLALSTRLSVSLFLNVQNVVKHAAATSFEFVNFKGIQNLVRNDLISFVIVVIYSEKWNASQIGQEGTPHKQHHHTWHYNCIRISQHFSSYRIFLLLFQLTSYKSNGENYTELYLIIHYVKNLDCHSWLFKTICNSIRRTQKQNGFSNVFRIG